MQCLDASIAFCQPRLGRADLHAAVVGFLAMSERYLLHSRIVIDDRGRPCIEPCDDDHRFAERREAFVGQGVLRAAAVRLMRDSALSRSAPR